jgi:hypothetical protein
MRVFLSVIRGAATMVASDGERTTAGRRGVIGLRGDPERNKICRTAILSALWAEDRLTQHKRRAAV